MTKKIFIGLLALLISSLVGCDRQLEKDWNKAKGVNSAEAYQEFLALHPRSQYDQEAKDKIEAFLVKAAINNVILFNLHPGPESALESIYRDYLKGGMSALSAENQKVVLDILTQKILTRNQADFALEMIKPSNESNGEAKIFSTGKLPFISMPPGDKYVSFLSIEATVEKDGAKNIWVETMPGSNFPFAMKNMISAKPSMEPVFPMGAGSKYKLIGELKNLFPKGNQEYFEVTFIGDEKDPLYFVILDEFGLTYLAGKGKVILPDQKEVTLPIK